MIRLILVALLFTPVLAAQDNVHEAIAELRREIAERDKQIEALTRRIENVENNRAVEDDHDVAQLPLGDHTKLRLMEISLEGLFAVGFSSATDDEIPGLQNGGHDPHRRGASLQQIELAMSGAVDPYFGATAIVVIGEEGFELEEAFFYTMSLPAGLQLEGGYFFTEFGLINPVHPHAWDFVDQPVIASRLMGGDGTRGLGVRLGWRAPLPWYSEVHVGAQNANDPTMVSFNGGEDGVGGRPRVERTVENAADFLYLLRWHNLITIATDWSLSLGASGLFGPNSSGDHGKTWLGGGDFLLQHRSGEFTHLKVQGEFMYRYFQADGLEPTALGDWGGYLQCVVGLHEQVSVGLRGEFADAFRDGATSRHEDALRDRRFRVSPMVEWRPSEYMHLRLQYNFDTMQHLPTSTAHSVWLSIGFQIGAHHDHD